MGPPGYRYGMDLGVYGVTLWGCGGDTGLWDPLVTDMGWIWGLWGVEVKRGLGTAWLQIWGWDLGSVGCGGDTGVWDPLVTDMGMGFWGLWGVE